MWSNERELQFLECYQPEPVLWNPKEVKHKDKQCNHDAWSGAAADSVYKPIRFAYELMDSFLNNIVQCRNTLNTDTQESVLRRRKNPIELQEAGKSMKEAMSSLNKVLNKPVVPEDDFDRYGKILANKLRKLSENRQFRNDNARSETGGGPKPPSADPITSQMIDMIPKEFEVDFNHFDSDGIIVDLQGNESTKHQALIQCVEEEHKLQIEKMRVPRMG
ncbi:unnamed protein product [Colias eurytheme]|nr:unnamed protein product [Colias eurytheme]